MPEDEVLREQVRAMRSDVSEIKSSMNKVAEALERLARLEERYSGAASGLERAFGSIGKIETRLCNLEQAQPIQALTSGWVTKVAWGAAGVIVATLLKSAGL